MDRARSVSADSVVVVVVIVDSGSIRVVGIASLRDPNHSCAVENALQQIVHINRTCI